MTEKKSGDWFWKTTRSRVSGAFVELRLAVPREEELGKWLAKRARELMDKAPALQGRNVSLSLVRDAEIRRLNSAFRRKRKPTDVLSFPLETYDGSLGDVVISLDTAKRQARAGGWTLQKELSRLLAHGLAHCAGHTHDGKADARKMARCERSMLGEDGMVGEAWSVAAPPTKRVSPARKKR